MLALAKSKGLRVGCAPDTFLGAGLQTCRKLLDDGLIGEPVAAAGWMLSRGPEGWHPDPEFFYQPGAGPMFDMGPYYLTALTSLLGTGAPGDGLGADLVPRAHHRQRGQAGPDDQGEHGHASSPACWILPGGAVGTLTTSFDVHGGDGAVHRNLRLGGHAVSCPTRITLAA